MPTFNSLSRKSARKCPHHAKETIEDTRAMQDATGYRAIAARANYLGQDRADIQFAVKEICKKMSAPCEGDNSKIKRLARYLKGNPRYVVHFPFRAIGNEITVWTDTDFAGCGESRKSTTGGVVMIGANCIKFWSVNQKVIALSSGEAEFYGIVSGSSQAIGVQSMAKDLGLELTIRVNTDASAAKGIASRRGVGKIRHIEVSQLWVQDKVANGQLTISKIGTRDNIADILTKHVDNETIKRHVLAMGCEFRTGRHELAPEA